MKVLVVKLHALGDLVIASPAIRLLRESLPDAELTLLTTDWAAPAGEANPCFDRRIVIPHRWIFARPWRNAVNIIGLAARLRGEHYDAAVVFHKHPAIERLIALASPGRLYAFGLGARRVLLDEARHSALTAWELAALAVNELTGKTPSAPRRAELRYEWQTSDDAERAAGLLLFRWGIGERPYAVLLPGGGGNPSVAASEKRWSASGFAGIAHRLHQEAGLKSLLLGGADDRDVCREVRDVATEAVYDLSGQTSVQTAAALLRRARMVVANDSGPLHIAAAVGAPTVGIFGPTGPQHKLPPGDTVAGVQLGLPCSPCYFGVFNGCIFDHVACLEDLPVQQVWTAVSNLIARTSTV
ncbi:MAG: glycosyltransferase family 9 protein [Calditrichaeota bacterium]|nr:glycosyltransferase family 9 protein [Calditrichota bacterium]